MPPEPIPTGSRLEQSGFATILTAPPIPLPDAPPPSPAEQETQRLARERGISVSHAEQMMNPDAETMRLAIALERRIRRGAAGNFVGTRIIRDPRPRYQFMFKRDAAATLARFTTDSRFVAAEGGVDRGELQALMQQWMARFEPHRLASSGGADPFAGTIEMHIGVSRSEFEAIAAREGWQLPPNMRLIFGPEIDLATIVAPGAARYVRAFPRADRTAHIILSVAKGGRVILSNGCFRLNAPDGPHVLFGRDTRLILDTEGYLAVQSVENPEERARIGEQMIWGGYPPAVESEPGVQAIRSHCGAGPIESVGEPTSAALFRVRPWAIDAYAERRRISRQAAWDEMKACWARQDARAPNSPEPLVDCDTGTPVNPPPPPTARPSNRG